MTIHRCVSIDILHVYHLVYCPSSAFQTGQKDTTRCNLHTNVQRNPYYTTAEVEHNGQKMFMTKKLKVHPTDNRRILPVHMQHWWHYGKLQDVIIKTVLVNSEIYAQGNTKQLLLPGNVSWYGSWSESLRYQTSIENCPFVSNSSTITVEAYGGEMLL